MAEPSHGSGAIVVEPYEVVGTTRSWRSESHRLVDPACLVTELRGLVRCEARHG